MKKLYIILFAIVMSFVGLSYAADFDMVLTPDTQNAISGTTVLFDVTVTSNTGFDVYLLQEFPNGVSYSDASLIPLNNPALMLGIDTNPIWLLSGGQTLNVQIEVVVELLSFTGLEVFSNIIDIYDENLVYTSAVSIIEPIGDILIEKILWGNEPQLTGDEVAYNVVISNIGSMEVTGVKFVDVWPSVVLTFPNQAFVNGVMQIPTIYNSIPNNYLFEIGDLMPGDSVQVFMTGTMDVLFPAGQEFVNTAFVLVNQDQYNTGNDTSTITNHVLGMADVYIDLNQISQNPTFVGDKVVYRLSYGNIGSHLASGVELRSILPNSIGFDSASLIPNIESNGLIQWNLGLLSGGVNGEIILIGIFLGGIQAGDMFVTTGSISTIDIESNYENNMNIATGQVTRLSVLDVKLYATNLTDDSRNVDIDTNILAISGDMVLLEIFVNNSGNVIETQTVSISNIGGFVGYNGLTSWNINISPQTSQRIVLSGIVGPKNFVSFTPVVNLNYSGILLSDNVVINEPLSCGDGLITQNEMCDTNGQIGNMLPGQHCENIAGMCTIVTDGILNVVNMEYTTSLGTGFLSDSVLVNYEIVLPDMQCNSLRSDFGVVIVDENNEGTMQFTCDTVDGLVAQEVKIDCGNGQIGIQNNTNTFVYSCNYEYDENNVNDNVYNVQCFVDDTTNDNCEKSIAVGEGFYGVCGNGELDDGEECDYQNREDDKIRIGRYLNDEGQIYRSYNDEGNYCKSCKIRDDNNTYVYQPPQCLVVNTTISIMEDELMPFWWRLWERDNLKIKSDYDCDSIDDDEEKTIIDKDSMKCNFEIYNGVDYQQEDEDPIGDFEIDCFEKEDGVMFEYFEDVYNVNFDRVSGKLIRDVTNLTDENIDIYGEYKLVLKDVEFEYCNPVTQEWDDGRLYEGICEVNFALTKPYIMQISTLGLDPTASSAVDFLKDFYDMNGLNLIKSTDIEDTMEVDQYDYAFDASVTKEMQSFKDKYMSLSILVNNDFDIGGSKTIGSLFGGAEVRKVPNKLIFFVKGNGTLTLKQLTNYFPSIPFTIYVEGMDVKVEGDVMTNGMIITDKKIYFEDEVGSDSRCDEGGQVVQGIFVAQGGFDAFEKLRNRNKNDQRCAWGNLQVKGVLIGGGLETLMNKKRSHLNGWFNVSSNSESSIKRERKNEIIEGAGVLIEYSPNLWTNLPPGAESFTESLDVYKK